MAEAFGNISSPKLANMLSEFIELPSDQLLDHKTFREFAVEVMNINNEVDLKEQRSAMLLMKRVILN